MCIWSQVYSTLNLGFTLIAGCWLFRAKIWFSKIISGWINNILMLLIGSHAFVFTHYALSSTTFFAFGKFFIFVFPFFLFLLWNSPIPFFQLPSLLPIRSVRLSLGFLQFLQFLTVFFWSTRISCNRKILSEQLLEWIALLLLTLLKSRAVSICLMLYGEV